MKEQRDRDEREKQEEIDNYKKDLKDLKEKVSVLQGDLSEKEVGITPRRCLVSALCVCCRCGHNVCRKGSDGRFTDSS